MLELTQLIARNDALREAVATARVQLAAAYESPTLATPREVAPASFLEARAQAEHAAGCRFVKFFAPGEDATP